MQTNCGRSDYRRVFRKVEVLALQRVIIYPDPTSDCIGIVCFVESSHDFSL